MARVILNEAYCFDDFLLIPRYNEVKSRQDVTLSTRLTKNITIQSPLISSNMDTVTTSPMMAAMRKLGCVGIMHRFMNAKECEDQLWNYQHLLGSVVPPVCVSLGVNGDADELLDLYCNMDVSVICIDVAHGHSQAVVEMIKKVKAKPHHFEIIAGNVATAEATVELIDAGADAIKVGIGPGSMCTTRMVTGNGVPQLSAIMECAEAAERHDVPIIADGGMRNSGDIVKALAAGASTIMSGSFFSGTDEAPGDIVEDFTTKQKFKKYQGMASNDAMIGWKGRYHAAAEGEATHTPLKGPVEDIVKTLLAGIRSGLTYQGAHDIVELRKNATFRLISKNSVSENGAHGK